MIRPLAPASLHGVALALGAVAFGLTMAGCARGESASERQMVQLREELRRVQTEQERAEQRLAALELRSAGAPATLHAPPVDTPKLRVVRLGPDGQDAKIRREGEGSWNGDRGDELGGDAPADDPEPRPQVRMRGRMAMEAPRPAPGSGPGRPSALDPDARVAYDGALALVHKKDFDRALEALAGFLVRYPDHPNADNAMYWRGECYFAQGDFTRAAEQFEGTLGRFPGGNKAPDAMLKLAMCQDKLGQTDKAGATYERLRREYPRSEAARRANRGAPQAKAQGQESP